MVFWSDHAFKAQYESCFQELAKCINDYYKAKEFSDEYPNFAAAYPLHDKMAKWIIKNPAEATSIIYICILVPYWN
jgi:hypothetical protein